MYSRNSLNQQKINLQNQLQKIEEEIFSAPPGSLLIKKDLKNGKEYLKYFNYNQGQLRYINQDNLDIAQKLAVKYFKSKCLKSIENELKILEYSLKHYDSYDNAVKNFYSNYPAYADLLPKNMTPNNEKIKEIFSAFPHSTYRPEGLKFPTLSGVRVRSKSEAYIANALYESGIPFIYEPSLYLGQQLFRPDFVVISPATLKQYIWEHFGLMDQPDYQKLTADKISRYHQYGYNIGDNFIATFESQNSPLNIEEVRAMINKYF